MGKDKEHLFRINHAKYFKVVVTVSVFFLKVFARPLFFLYYGLRVYGKKNLKNTKKGIIVSNHTMNMDAYIIGTTLWPKLIWYAVEANNILRKDVGWFNRINGAFGIHETFPMSIGTSVKEAMKSNEFVTIFPEGKQHFRYQDVQPFSKGAFYLALECGVPVIPAAVVLYGRKFFRHSAWVPPKIKIFYLPPIETKDLLKEGESIRKKSNWLAEEVRRMIQETIDREGGHKDLAIEPLFK